MSNVTNLILTTGIRDTPEYTDILEQVNAYFLTTERHSGFTQVENEGGTKALECGIFTGAFNCLNLEALIEHLRTKVSWKDKDEAQLMVKRQDDDRFHVVNLFPEAIVRDDTPLEA